MSKIYFYFISLFILLASNILAQTDTITILHVNDSHSTLEAIGPRDENLDGTLGGVSRVATLVGMTKMTEPNVLFLHAGDISIGDVFFNRNFHVPELQILDALGVDAMTLGNHEFDLGPLALLGSLMYTFPTATDAFPLLTANVDFSDPTISGLEDYVDAYTVKEFGDLKVGIFGLTTPATNLLSNPYPAVVSEDIVNIAATMVGTLRTVENCDVVIFLSHLGVNLDQLIVSYVPGINVIVGGHDHYMYEEPITMIDPMGGTTWIVQARSNYLYAGKMKLVVDGANVQLLDYQLIPIDTNIPQEPVVQGMVDYLIADIENFYSIPFYTQPMGYASSFFAEETKDLLTLGVHDTPLGNLVADAFRFKTSTNIALQAGGSIALPLWEGTFTPGDLFRANGYGFNLVNTLGFQLATFDLSGMDILTGLTFGLSEIEMNDEFLIQVSGMEYTYDGTKPAAERLVSVNINGTPINTAATYSVTANEMVLGILNYIGIIPSNVTILNGITEFQALSEYVMSQNNFIQPKTLGRVLNVGNRDSRSTVIGAGWMNSSQGSYPLNKLLCDKLFFEFHMMDRGLNYEPFGKVTIRYPQANFTFKSNVCNWLLLENQTATLRGTGKINNQGNFGFLLIAEDSPDKLRIVIWDKNNGDNIVYDNLAPQNIHGAIIMYNRCVLAKEGDEEILTAPVEFALEQNYPNPFNPSTTINYSIAEAGNVELKVYDILGNEVATLVNEYKPEGKYEVEFNSHSGEVRNLTSGVYIYTLRISNYIQTKKMILLK
ncbi:MAG TPA: 5'-nucleotidase C-terminal domain-containing protein [Ignavibacteriaceae bacterium]|nr:5'-nucleotidase C-terminal domain-containing protein [Ignavibacteriaceae bacterium]